MPRKKETKLTEREFDKKMIDLQRKNEVIDVEKFYVNGTLDNLEEIVENKKNEMVELLNNYVYLAEGRKYNPYLVSTYFFKAINPLGNIEPQYSSEKLGIVWDLYMYLIEQVNIKIGAFQPTISHFCKFAGITTSTLKGYKSKGDIQMQIIVNKIFDETFDSNVLLAQNKILSNRSTELRVKVENEVEEKPQVRVNVNVETEVDLGQISSRLEEIQKFKKVKKAENEQVIEVDYDEEY